MMGNYHVRFDGGFREKVSIQTTRPFTYPTMLVVDLVPSYGRCRFQTRIK